MFPMNSDSEYVCSSLLNRFGIVAVVAWHAVELI